MAAVDDNYNLALQRWNDGEKLQAEQELQELIGWREAADKLLALRLEIADNAFEKEDYDTALEYYGLLPVTAETGVKQETATRGKLYQQAFKALENGDLDTAHKLFASAKGFKDADQRAEKIEKYQQASQLLAEKKYLEAKTVLMNLGDFLDSSTKLETCNQTLYSEASTLLKLNKLAEAYSFFEEISDYSDSAEIIKELDDKYTSAIKLLEEKHFDDAITAFQNLYNFKDSETNVNKARYQKAEALLNDGKYEEAMSAYAILGEYQDSQEKINLCKYNIADQLYSNKEIDAAITAFEEIAAYSDSQERANSIRFEKASALWQSGELQPAAEEFKALGNYKNAAADLVKVSTELAEKSMANKDYAVALAAYQVMEQTDEIKEREYQLAQTCYDEGLFEVATKAYEGLGQYQLSLSKLPIARYAWADQLFKNGQYEEAAEQFVILGDMTDSAERANESVYLLANQFLDAENFDKAKELFGTIANYKDSSTLVKECDYRKAKSLFEEKNYSGAEEIYKVLGNYEDSSTKTQECIYKQAEDLFNKGKYADARTLYAQYDYSDSKEMAKECAYLIAKAQMESKQYAEAESMLGNCSDYKDSETQIKECRYQQGKMLLDNKQYAEALLFYTSLDYKDSEKLFAQCHYELGKIAQVQGDVEGAITQYAYAVNNDDAQEELFALAKDYAAINETEKAIQLLWLIHSKEEAKNLLEELGGLKTQAGQTGIAVLAFLSIDENDLDDITELLKTVPISSFVALLEECKLLPEEMQFSQFILYRYASVLMAVERYEEAYEIYYKIQDYKDTKDILTGDSHLLEILNERVMPFKTKGSLVIFGNYQQEEGVLTPIEWIVLETTEEKSLLISRFALDAIPFGIWDDYWESSSIRSWLNGSFYESAFDYNEQQLILESEIDNSEDGSATTRDKLFLLSLKEVGTYFESKEGRKCKATSLAISKNIYKDDDDNCYWWLRSHGSEKGSMEFISKTGGWGQAWSNSTQYCVRPAFWIDLTKIH